MSVATQELGPIHTKPAHFGHGTIPLTSSEIYRHDVDALHQAVQTGFPSVNHTETTSPSRSVSNPVDTHTYSDGTEIAINGT